MAQKFGRVINKPNADVFALIPTLHSKQTEVLKCLHLKCKMKNLKWYMDIDECAINYKDEISRQVFLIQYLN